MGVIIFSKYRHNNIWGHNDYHVCPAQAVTVTSTFRVSSHLVHYGVHYPKQWSTSQVLKVGRGPPWGSGSKTDPGGIQKMEGKNYSCHWVLQSQNDCSVYLTCVLWRLLAKSWDFFGIKEHNPDDVRNIGNERNWRHKLRKGRGGAFLQALSEGNPTVSHFEYSLIWLTVFAFTQFVPTASKATFSQNTRQPVNLFWQRTGRHR